MTTNYITTVGTNGRSSFYGTYDQNGLVWEWMDGNYTNYGNDGNNTYRKVYRGGSWGTKTYASLDVNNRIGVPGIPGSEEKNDDIPLGFRICTMGNVNSPRLHLENYVHVQNPNNNNDISTGLGQVNYNFYIRKYLITVKEYCLFLNSVAQTPQDAVTYDLYNDKIGYYNTITKTLTGGINVYTVNQNMDYKPICSVSWFNAMRYCNWLHNNMPSGSGPSNSTTESGVYTIPNQRINFDGITETELQNLTRATTTSYWIPTENEWYKAAYFDPDKSSYSAIEIGGIDHTGSGVSPGGRDANWKVVALPAGSDLATTNTVPYDAFVFTTIPSVYVTSSLTRPVEQEPNNGSVEFNAKWIGAQIEPLAPNFDFIESYHIVYSGNVYAQENGVGLIEFSAAGANSVGFFIGGTLINTDTRYPTISGGQQIGNFQQGIGTWKNFSAEVTVSQGDNPFFAVVYDSDSANFGGGFILTGPTNYQNLYWPYATRSVTPPCPVEAVSPQGDGTDVLDNCPAVCQIGRPEITDYQIQSDIGQCYPDRLSISWDVSNMAGYILDEFGNYKICNYTYIPEYNGTSSSVVEEITDLTCGNYYIPVNNVPKMIIEVIVEDNINNITETKIVNVVPISLSGYTQNIDITTGYNQCGGPSDIVLRECATYRIAISVLLPNGQIGDRAISGRMYYTSTNTNGGVCVSYVNAIQNIDKAVRPLIISDAEDASYNGVYTWNNGNSRYQNSNNTRWMEFDTQFSFELKSASETKYSIPYNANKAIIIPQQAGSPGFGGAAILGGVWQNYGSSPTTYSNLKVKLHDYCLYPEVTTDLKIYCLGQWVSEPRALYNSIYANPPSTGCAYVGVLPCADDEGSSYLLLPTIKHEI